MADKAEKKPEAPAAAAPAAPAAEKKEGAAHGGAAKAGILGKLPVLLGGVMIIEAAVLFAGFKFLGSGAPRAAEGAELTEGEVQGENERRGRRPGVQGPQQAQRTIIPL
jgi:hypothetical protein